MLKKISEINLVVTTIVLINIIKLENVIVESTLTNINDNVSKLTIKMPDIRPDHAEQYLCIAHRVPVTKKGHYIVGFNPDSDSSRVHHMLMYGCQEPGIYQRDSPNFVWDCGEMQQNINDQKQLITYERGPVCNSNKKFKILYGWAMDAPALKLPDEVGFKIGGQESNVEFLVLQVHFGQVDKFKQLPSLTDNSGVILDLRLNDKNSGITKQAGVLVLISVGKVLKGKSKHEIWCDIDEDIDIHPFKYRVHTHKLGTHVMGAKIGKNHSKIIINNNYDNNKNKKIKLMKNNYFKEFLRNTNNNLMNDKFSIENDLEERNDEENVVIGENDPQKPQMFYPVKDENLIISKGDKIYAKCDFYNNRTNVVKIGATGNDEMCNFYLMYWTNNENLLSKESCISLNPKDMYSKFW